MEQIAVDERLEIMGKAVDILASRGVAATFEYPGFISINLGRGEYPYLHIGDGSGYDYSASLSNDGWDDSIEHDFTAPLTATPEELAEAITKVAV